MIIIDNFLESYAELKEKSINGQFEDIKSPADGVTYPLICADIPDSVKSEVQERLETIFNKVSINYIFMRKSPQGVPVPHMAHTDNSMGDFSLMLYLNDYPEGGTGLIRHKKTGIAFAPESEDFIAIAQHDQNNPNEWALYDRSVMKENRAAIFDAHLFHCALPVGGFGSGSESRCVLTAFFSVIK